MQNDNEEDEEQAEDDADDEEKLEENDEGNAEDEGSLTSDDNDQVDSSGLEVGMLRVRGERPLSKSKSKSKSKNKSKSKSKSKNKSTSKASTCHGDIPTQQQRIPCAALAGLTTFKGNADKHGHFRKTARNVCRSNSDFGKEARKNCCKTCETAPMTAIFGGDKRGHPSKGKSDAMQLPEDIRAQQCTLDKCQECESQDNCFQAVSLYRQRGTIGDLFHGHLLTKNVTSIHGHPFTKLSVQKDLTFTSYRASFYAKCDAGDLAKIYVLIKEIQNGIAKIFMDDIYKDTLKEKGSKYQDGLKTNGEAFQLSVQFFPTNKQAPSSVTIKATLGNVRPKFEQCMDHKTCLTAMGNMKLKASFALRNKNAYQLSCLRRAAVPDWLKATCEAWRSCVEENPSLAKYLKTSLSAANPSMLQIEDTSATKANRQDECFDPAIADAEALECECMVYLQEACPGDDEECFKKAYCADKRVCQDWKDDNDCKKPSLLQAESNSPKAYMALAAERRSSHNDSSANILTDNLESALQGKCASQ